MSRSMFSWTAWTRSRRTVLFSLLGSLCLAPKEQGQTAQEEQGQDDRKSKFPDPNEEPRLPDGKSQRNAIAKEEHKKALEDADQLVTEAQELRDQLKAAGTYVVPLGSVKKTEEIEKLAKRIRGRLKA